MPAKTVTLVTGAASGIGRATVEHLTRIGGRVIAVDRSADSMDWLDEGSTCVVVGDVTDAATSDAAVAAAQERFGGL
ncbi:MAG TPA: SDR family NAD(P)-dependent oxidoreductase, partial [Jatrophihabitantaceae bacterium]|nr:SDR family NAD(P)-dependent oxidoreductase [Jatrophihabitantaceae bacterium]